MRRILFLFSLLVPVSALLTEPAMAQNLNSFQRYFGTMDYSVTGTGGIRGTGKLDTLTNEYLTEKAISVDLPPAAELVAAFLYWETLEKTSLPSSARGWLSYPTNPNARVKILGKPLGNGTAPCWSNGGSTGSSNGAPTLRVYRADVLRYLKAPDSSSVSSQITVRLSDSGNKGNKVPLTEGASLVLVYRHPSLTFKSIVINDGSQTMDNATDSMSLTINGFDQALTGAAKITHIVGNGQSNFSERLFFNNTLLATNPFQSGWDNRTYDVSSLVIPASAPAGQVIGSATTRVDHLGQPFDCLSWGAVVFSTTVRDTDEDGLLDVWETDGYKVNGAVTVDLPGMGANPRKKDLFIEADYMVEKANDALGTPHSHLPHLQTLQMVGQAFADAPVDNPDGSKGIHVVFDVGDHYQGESFILKGVPLKGGDELDERSKATFCTQFKPANPSTGVPAKCLFPNQPGLISWKKGIQHLKNNYFSDDRENIFHYVLFGHGLAIKGANLPLVNGAFQGYSSKSTSGRADLPGNTVAVTLGLWRSSPPDTNVGSANLQAATLFHEVAHNLWGFHGGTTLDGPFTINDKIVSRPNCNPNRQSSLNYLYQSAGLLDAQSVFRVNLSGQVLTALSGAQDEAGLKENEGLGFGETAYRLRWYAPLSTVQGRFRQPVNGSGITIRAAQAHCDGLLPIGSSETPVTRVDGQGVAGNPLARMPVDWDYDDTVRFLTNFADINFNGIQDVTSDFRGSDDWVALVNLHGLQQVGSGRNLFSLSLGVTAADLLREEESELGEDDLGEDDLGEDDLGEDDLGEDDLGEDDLGEDDLGEVSDINEGTAIAIGGSGPTALAASIPSGAPAILLNWTPPAFGGVIQKYLIYRSGLGDAFKEIGQSLTPTFTDTTFIRGRAFNYLVIAVFEGGEMSALSNIVVITAP